MARHWISYSVDQDQRRRRGRRWRLRWPWNWGRDDRYGRPTVVWPDPALRRVRYRDDGKRRSIWPWLLLLLLLLLFLGILGFLLFDDPDQSEAPNGREARANLPLPTVWFPQGLPRPTTRLWTCPEPRTGASWFPFRTGPRFSSRMTPPSWTLATVPATTSGTC